MGIILETLHEEYIIPKNAVTTQRLHVLYIVQFTLLARYTSTKLELKQCSRCCQQEVKYTGRLELMHNVNA